MTASDFYALWFLATFATICFVWRRWVIRERTEAPAPDDTTRICAVVGVLRPARYTAEEIALVRDVPLCDWQRVIDAHRLMGAVTTGDDVLAMWDGGVA